MNKEDLAKMRINREHKLIADFSAYRSKVIVRSVISVIPAYALAFFLFPMLRNVGLTVEATVFLFFSLTVPILLAFLVYICKALNFIIALRLATLDENVACEEFIK